MVVKNYLRSFGVTGVKRSFSTCIFFKLSNCYFSDMLHGRVMWLIHISQLDTLYKSYGRKNSSGVIWGHRGQILIFTKNALSPLCYIVYPCNLYIIISLRHSTFIMGSKVNMGSFGVIGVKSLFSIKVTLSPLYYIVYPCNSYIIISLRPSTYVMGSEVNMGSFGVTGVKYCFSVKMHYLLYVTSHIHVTHI